MKVYVQKAHEFALPETRRRRSSWSARAPASRRSAPSCRSAGDRAQGRNWLFFGHQRLATDFFYRDELARA